MATLATMAQLARNAASNREFYSSLYSALMREPWADHEESYSALDNFVRGHFRYRGENVEVIRTPEFMLNDLMTTGKFEGDCDDAATFIAAIAKTLGMMCRFVAIRYRGDSFEHVFVEIYDPVAAQWRVFDPTVKHGTRYDEIERMVESV